MTTYRVEQTVVADIEADTLDEAVDFMRHRIEMACEYLETAWGTPHASPLFQLGTTVTPKAKPALGST